MDTKFSKGDANSNDPRFTSDNWTYFYEEAKAKLEADAMALRGLYYIAETLACDNCKALYTHEVETERVELYRLTEIMEFCSRCAPVLALADILSRGVKLADEPPKLDALDRTYSPSEALAAGHCAYWSNEPMGCGHIGWRYVQEGGCVDCEHEVLSSPPTEAEIKESAESKAYWKANGSRVAREQAEQKRTEERKKRERINGENAERAKAQDKLRKRAEREAENAEKIANGESPKRRGRPRKTVEGVITDGV
jgi:hypothetical protein